MNPGGYVCTWVARGSAGRPSRSRQCHQLSIRLRASSRTCLEGVSVKHSTRRPCDRNCADTSLDPTKKWLDCSRSLGGVQPLLGGPWVCLLYSKTLEWQGG